MCAKESSIAELVNRDYGIAPLRLRLLGSFWNTTYRVDSDAGELFVLRIAAPSIKDPTSIEREICWLNYVTANSDLLVPGAVSAINGNYVTQIGFGDESRLCCLFRWIEGESVGARWPENALQQIGHIVGTLHSLSQQFDPPAFMARPAEIRHSDEAEMQRVRNPEWLDWLKANSDVSRQDLRILSSAIEIVSSELKAPRDEGWNSGLCHGDLHPGNMIVTPEGMAVIDFDQLGWGLFDVELAWLLSTAADLCRLPELGKREACLAAYQRIRSLPFSSKREFAVRIAFFHLLHFDWLHSLSDPKMRDEHSRTIRTRIDVLRDFISE